jgi:hypothetical protein
MLRQTLARKYERLQGICYSGEFEKLKQVLVNLLTPNQIHELLFCIGRDTRILNHGVK